MHRRCWISNRTLSRVSFARILRPLQGLFHARWSTNLHEVEAFAMDNKGFQDEERERRAKIKRMFSWSDGLPGWVSILFIKTEVTFQISRISRLIHLLNERKFYANTYAYEILWKSKVFGLVGIFRSEFSRRQISSLTRIEIMLRRNLPNLLIRSVHTREYRHYRFSFLESG